MYRKQLTEALRKFSYGFYIVSARSGNYLAAGAVNWLSQASFHPPLIMMAIKEDSHLHEYISRSGAFAVSVVGEEQEHILPEFFKATNVEGNKINGLPFADGMTGSPVFVDLPASVECKVVEKISMGDHSIFVGEIVNAGVRYDVEPLVDKETEYKYAG